MDLALSREVNRQGQRNLAINQGINQIRKHVGSKVSFGSVFR